MQSPRQFLDLILPRFCVGCEKEGLWLCDNCLSAIPLNTEMRCPLCETITIAGRICSRHGHPAIDGVLAAGHYHHPTLRKALHRFKYGFAVELASHVSQFLLRSVRAHITLLPEHPLVIPIPLSSQKYRLRGFNQTEFLARAVAKELNAPYITHILCRDQEIVPQALLKEEERRMNFSDTFFVESPKEICNRDILLIDDVSTTGATLEVAARALKNAGATSVYGLVLARG